MQSDAAPAARSWLPLIFALSFADITAAFESIMVFAALKAIITTFGDPIGAGWAVTAYLLCAAAAAAICGRLGDIYGRKPVLLVMLAISALGSLISALSPELPGIIAGRALQGAAGAILPLSYGIAKEKAPTERVPMALGILVGAGSIGTGAGLIIGGLLVDTGHWRHLFIFSTILALLSMPVVAWLIPKGASSPRPLAQLDIVGGLLFVPSIAALLLSLSIGAQQGWATALPWSFGVVGLLGVTMWAVYELRHKEPLIDIRLLVSRGLLLPIVCTALMAMGPLQSTQMLYLLLQQPVWTGVGLGLTATFVGLLNLPANIGGTLFGPLAGKFAERFGSGTAIWVAFAINAAGWGILALQHDAVWLIVFLKTCFFVAGTVLCYLGVSAALMEAAPPARSSEVAGMMIVVRALSQAVGAQLLMLLLTVHTIPDPARPAMRFPTETAYLLAMGMLAGVCLLGVFVALGINRQRRHERRDLTDFAATPGPAR